LVGLTIFSIVITSIYATLRSGIIAWEKGNENISYAREARLAMERISTDIRNAAHLGNKKFEGSSNGLRFIALNTEQGGSTYGRGSTPIRDSISSSCLCEISYLYEEDRLLRIETPLIWTKSLVSTETIAGPKKVSFSYLNKERGDWCSFWSSVSLPDAVRINLEIGGKTFTTMVRSSR